MTQFPANAEQIALSFLGLPEDQKQRIINRLRAAPLGQLEQELKKAQNGTDAQSRFIRFLFISELSSGSLPSPSNKRVKPSQIG